MRLSISGFAKFRQISLTVKPNVNNFKHFKHFLPFNSHSKVQCLLQFYNSFFYFFLLEEIIMAMIIQNLKTIPPYWWELFWSIHTHWLDLSLNSYSWLNNIRIRLLTGLSLNLNKINEAFKVSLDGSLLLAVGSPIWEPPASSGEPNLGSPLLAGI